MKEKKAKMLIMIAILLIASLTVLFIAARRVYDAQFDYRCTTREKDAFELAQFEGLAGKRYTFHTKQGHQLVGYLYEQTEKAVSPKGVIVFAHGLGNGGQNGYMDIFHHITKRGYYVFAYDATANDESEGDAVGGLPQGLIDLDYAIDFVDAIEEIRDLPVMLMGYSWGALSAVNVLNNHPEVKAVVSLAGCNRSLDLIEYQGCKRVGKIARVLLPFAWLHEYLTYGDYAFTTAIKGFEKSECRVMVVHGAKDRTVPIEYGYEAFYQKYAQDERFVFLKYSDRDHDLLDVRKGVRDLELMDRIADFFDQTLLEKE